MVYVYTLPQVEKSAPTADHFVLISNATVSSFAKFSILWEH